MSSTATASTPLSVAALDLEAFTVLEVLNERGTQCLSSIYLASQDASENKESQSHAIQEASEFCNDAAEQVMLTSASVVGPDASTVICSTTLLRALTRLLDTLHRMDALRASRYEALHPGSPPSAKSQSQQQHTHHAALRRVLFQGRQKQPTREEPAARAPSKSSTATSAEEAVAAEPIQQDVPSAITGGMGVDTDAVAAAVGDTSTAGNGKRKVLGLLGRRQKRNAAEEEPKETGSPLIKARKLAAGARGSDADPPARSEASTAVPETAIADNDSPVKLVEAEHESSPPSTPLAAVQSDDAAETGISCTGLEAGLDEWEAFLAEPWTAVQLVHSRLQAVPYHPVLLARLARTLLRVLNGKGGIQPLLAGDWDTAACALSAVLFLLHADGQEDAEAAASPQLGAKKLLKCLKALRQRPIIPLMAGNFLCLMTLLQASPALVALGAQHGKEWQVITAHELEGRSLAAAERLFHIQSQAVAARSVHDMFVEAVTAFALEVEEQPTEDNSGNPSLVVKALEVGMAGVACLHLWRQQLLSFQAWRAVCPVPSTGQAPDEGGTRQLPLAQEDLEAVVEVLALLKGLESLLEDCTAWLQPLLHRAMYAHVQQFLQITVPSWLKPSVPNKVQAALVLLRETLGDWPEGQAAPLKRPTKSQGFAALLKGPFRGGRQALEPALPSVDDAPAAATRNLLLSGAATAAISALRAGLEGQLPTIRQTQLSGTLPFAMRAVAPSPRQLQQLNHALEQILRDCGTKGLFRGSSLSANKQKELEALNAMWLQWDAFLCLEDAISEGANMADMTLHECLTNVPAEDSLAAQLGFAALRSERGGPMEDCLLPLQLYNDVYSRLDDLCVTHLLPRLTGQASACLDLLLAGLAEEAFRHHKALAALSLSEPSARGQCALLPPLSIHRRFEGVLQMHSMPLLDRSVDVASEMAERLGRLLRENAQFLITRYEGGRAASICELDALVAVLRAAHSLLCTIVCVEPWAQIWSSTDGSSSLASYQGRTASHTAQDIVQSLLTTFTYCDVTHRFLPGDKTGAPPSLDSHAEPAMLWGPGGSAGLFASWASAHAAFVGHSHLTALLNLTGPAGVALLVQNLEDNTIQLLQTQISPGVTEARERMHQLGTTTSSRSMPSAQAGHRFWTQGLAKALGGDLQRELMLRQLSELGNAFALLCLLDEVVAARQDAAFLLAAPLLGDTAAPSTHLSQQGSATGDAIGPLQQAYDNLVEAGSMRQQPSAPLDSSAHPAAALIQEAIQAGWRDTQQGSLLARSLQRIRQALAPLSLSWQEPPPQAHHVVSAALFALCSPKTSREERSLAPGPTKQRLRQALPTEWDSRGDGPALGALLLVGLLGQSAAFQVADLCLGILSAAAFDAPTDFGPELSAFLVRAQSLATLAIPTFARVDAALPARVPPGVAVAGQQGTKPHMVAADLLPFAAPFAETPAFKPVLETAESIEPVESGMQGSEEDPVYLSGFATTSPTWKAVQSGLGHSSELPREAASASPQLPAPLPAWQELYDDEEESPTAVDGCAGSDMPGADEPPAWPTMDVSVSPRGGVMWNQPLQTSLPYFQRSPAPLPDTERQYYQLSTDPGYLSDPWPASVEVVLPDREDIEPGRDLLAAWGQLPRQDFWAAEEEPHAAGLWHARHAPTAHKVVQQVVESEALASHRGSFERPAARQTEQPLPEREPQEPAGLATEALAGVLLQSEEPAQPQGKEPSATRCAGPRHSQSTVSSSANGADPAHMDPADHQFIAAAEQLPEGPAMKQPDCQGEMTAAGLSRDLYDISDAEGESSSEHPSQLKSANEQQPRRDLHDISDAEGGSSSKHPSQLESADEQQPQAGGSSGSLLDESAMGMVAITHSDVEAPQEELQLVEAAARKLEGTVPADIAEVEAKEGAVPTATASTAAEAVHVMRQTQDSSRPSAEQLGGITTDEPEPEESNSVTQGPSQPDEGGKASPEVSNLPGRAETAEGPAGSPAKEQTSDSLESPPNLPQPGSVADLVRRWTPTKPASEPATPAAEPMARESEPAHSTAAQSNATAEMIQAGQPAAAPELASARGSKLRAPISAASLIAAMATSTAAAALKGEDAVPGGQPECCVTPELSTVMEEETALPPEGHEAEAGGRHPPEQAAAVQPAAVDALSSAAGLATLPHKSLELLPAIAVGFNRFATLEGASGEVESEEPRALSDRAQTESRRRSPRRKKAKTPKSRGRTLTGSTTEGPSEGDAATGSLSEQEDARAPASGSADALQQEQGPVPASGGQVSKQPLNGNSAEPLGNSVTASEPDTAAALPEVQPKLITMQPATETQQEALTDPEGTAYSTAATQAEVAPEPEQKTGLQAHPLAQPTQIAGIKGAAATSAAGQSASGSGNAAAVALSEMATPTSQEQASIASGGPSDSACADNKSASHKELQGSEIALDSSTPRLGRGEINKASGRNGAVKPSVAVHSGASDEVPATPIRPTASTAPQTPFTKWATELGEGLFGRLPKPRRSADSNAEKSPGSKGGGFSLESFF